VKFCPFGFLNENLNAFLKVIKKLQNLENNKIFFQKFFLHLWTEIRKRFSKERIFSFECSKKTFLNFSKKIINKKLDPKFFFLSGLIDN